MFGIFGFEPTEEQVEKIKEHIDKEEMEGKSAMNDVKSWFAKASVDDLMLVRRLIGVFQGGGESSLAYWDGMSASLLMHKHHVCIRHGVDHEAQEFEALVGGVPVTIPVKQKSGSTPAKGEEGHPDYEVDLELYGLEWVEDRIPDSEEQGNVHLRCKECHLYSVSLVDRMLRVPGIDGCEGCQNKAKWG